MGDERWAGAYGIEADFWADGDCKVVYIPISEIKASTSAMAELWLYAGMSQK